MANPNIFANADAAAGYARYRPYFHPVAIDHMRTLRPHAANALDVACGTGQSSRALIEIADTVTGIDIAPDMLANAYRDPRVRYLIGRAEDLPFPNRHFDLVIVSLALHWFDRTRFLREARRVIRPDGLFVKYNAHFTARMIGNDAYKIWNDEYYYPTYRPPPRDNNALSKTQAANHGFMLIDNRSLFHEVTMSPETLAGYLATHSNVLSVAAGDPARLAEIRANLLRRITPLFQDAPTRAFVFRCSFTALAPT